MPGTRRLFFALWPDEAVRKQLDTAARKYRPQQSRAINKANLHATLVFIGSVRDEFLPAIFQAGDSIQPRTFTLYLQQLQVWRRPQVLCLCPESVPDVLHQLHDDLVSALGKNEINFDERSYRPHVTLARKVRKSIDTGVLEKTIEWPVRGFSLIESRSSESGVQYEPLKTWE
jgi:2'-5' RNA ligase